MRQERERSPFSLYTNLPQNARNAASTHRIAHGGQSCVPRRLGPGFPRWKSFDTRPPYRPQGRARLFELRISDTSAVPHCFRGAPDGAVQHTVGVPGAVRARTIYFKSKTVVETSRHRAPRHRDANKHAVVRTSYTELVPARRFIMAMKITHKSARRAESYRNDAEGHGADQVKLKR